MVTMGNVYMHRKAYSLYLLIQAQAKQQCLSKGMCVQGGVYPWLALFSNPCTIIIDTHAQFLSWQLESNDTVGKRSSARDAATNCS